MNRKMEAGASAPALGGSSRARSFVGVAAFLYPLRHSNASRHVISNGCNVNQIRSGRAQRKIPKLMFSPLHRFCRYTQYFSSMRQDDRQLIRHSCRYNSCHTYFINERTDYLQFLLNFFIFYVSISTIHALSPAETRDFLLTNNSKGYFAATTILLSFVSSVQLFRILFDLKLHQIFDYSQNIVTFSIMLSLYCLLMQCFFVRSCHNVLISNLQRHPIFRNFKRQEEYFRVVDSDSVATFYRRQSIYAITCIEAKPKDSNKRKARAS